MFVIGVLVIEVIFLLKKCGVKSICFMCLIVVFEGVEKM